MGLNYELFHIAIEHTNIIHAQKAALKDIFAFRILAIYPPGIVEQQFLKHAL